METNFVDVVARQVSTADLIKIKKAAQDHGQLTVSTSVYSLTSCFWWMFTSCYWFVLCIDIKLHPTVLPSGVTITLAASATLGGLAVQGGPTPPVLCHFVERNNMGSKI